MGSSQASPPPPAGQIFSFDRGLSIRLAESIATLSTIAYALAALLARVCSSARLSVFASLALCALIAFATELALGFRSDNQASLLRLSLCIAGAAAAITLYWIQVNLLREIRRSELGVRI